MSDAAPNQPTAGQPSTSGCVGSGEREVAQGESLPSIAVETGHNWQTLWDHPENADLKGARKDPAVLYPGDRVFVPPIRLRQEPGATERRHRFRRLGAMVILRMAFLHEGQPRANQPYVGDIDGVLIDGVLDREGMFKHRVPPNARRLFIRIGRDADEQTEHEFDLSGLDPIDTISGIQARLNNLGYDAGLVDDVWGPQTRCALTEFQKDAGLPASGELNDATRQALLSEHGS